MAVKIKWRRDTAANWTNHNTVLAAGEPGFETDTGAYKIGNGSSGWNSLPYGSFSTNPIAALFTNQSNNPSPPASGKLDVYGKSIAGRMMLKHEGPAGLITAVQPFFARNKVGYWAPPGNTTTVPGVFGYTAVSVSGTATAATVAATNFYTRMRRLSYVSTTSTNAYAGNRVATAQVTMDQGFFKIVRFGISDSPLVSPANMFLGVTATTSAPSGGTEPSALLNCIGVGHSSTDSNLKIFYASSTVAQPPIDLGANFPINTTNTDAYEFALFVPPGVDYTAYYEVTRLNTGNVVTGVLTGDSSQTYLPSPLNTLTYASHWRCNLSSGAAVSLDIMSDYIETDN